MKNFGIIYKAVNQKTHEVYIGISTKGLNSRVKDHEYKASKKEGSKFQRAIATYGSEAFKWEQIDTANDINELAKKEKEYVFKYNSKVEGYNSDSGGGIKKKVYQYDLKGMLIGEYQSLNDASSVTSVSKKRISHACLSNTHLLKNYYWTYDSGFSLKNSKDLRKKPVLQLELNYVYVAKYKSVAEASRKTGVSKTCIARVCRGERENSRGYIWKYI